MAAATSARRFSVLDLIETVGNLLPAPATLFILGALLVMALSQLGVSLGWSVEQVRPEVLTQPRLDASGQPILDQAGQPLFEVVRDSAGRPRTELRTHGEPLRAVSLLTADGLYWIAANLVKNFVEFPPLGIVLVGMLGVGVAERSGLIAALLKALMLVAPRRLLTPIIVFLGINSSLASDAGYIVLPPLAAALFLSVGRSPLVGIAAVFAGISAGFSANLLITAGDALVASLTTTGAQIIAPDYVVQPTCNWYFMIGSVFLLTFLGWGVTAWFVEPRMRNKPAEEGGPAPVSEEALAAQQLTPTESFGLRVGGLVFLVTLGLILAMIFLPGWPLHGQVQLGPRMTDRWSQAIVFIIFFVFLIPGLAFGLATGTIRNEKEAARVMNETMASVAPVIVLAFFAAQFIKFFEYSNLGRMLAMAGGAALARSQLPPEFLITVFVLLSLTLNLFIGSMSAKWAMMAPIFVPMFMLVGLSPELTQAAYRVGDSVTNTITPLNSYLIIILALIQRYVPRAGMGTLLALMLPYSIAFTIVWLLFLLGWYTSGFPLGLGGPLSYAPTVP